jgi:uncharacterized protein (TIGR03382 family)
MCRPVLDLQAAGKPTPNLTQAECTQATEVCVPMFFILENSPVCTADAEGIAGAVVNGEQGQCGPIKTAKNPTGYVNGEGRADVLNAGTGCPAGNLCIPCSQRKDFPGCAKNVPASQYQAFNHEVYEEGLRQYHAGEVVGGCQSSHTEAPGLLVLVLSGLYLLRRRRNDFAR